MHSRRQQLGMTFWGMSFVLGVIGFFFFLLFKLFPPYMEDFKVSAALESLSRQSDLATMTKTDIMNALGKRFSVDNIDAVKLERDLTIEPHGRTRAVRIRYENVIPIVGNVSILLEFDHSKEVASSGE